MNVMTKAENMHVFLLSFFEKYVSLHWERKQLSSSSWGQMATGSILGPPDLRKHLGDLLEALIYKSNDLQWLVILSGSNIWLEKAKYLNNSYLLSSGLFMFSIYGMCPEGWQL